MKYSKRYLLSWGPGLDSGWYWTENAECFLALSPSTVSSFKLKWVMSTLFGNELAFTENPWFWLVISIFPFNKFLTACGYQVVDDAQEELDLRRKDEDFYI